ncbi:nuclease Le1 [Cylindrobasidium torrendii FP15055 ss-10]|uniref:Nuclease Le1 n=1 Tax=Cylindrobasidium torrendii FP15055 ss-10 TaxID=1314674 RepID=A0A0D7B2J7_9AGAR|nr:nuclease Le1 [Cylindrobasidium torrendii FP15055 ss-10]
MFSLPVLLPVVASAIPAAYAWGANGHHTVGFVAMEFLAPNALEFVTANLDANETLGEAATWADEIKGGADAASWKWASVLHYIDALDEPPTECSVDEKRDCADGNCILTAIANYTSQVVDTSLSGTELNVALKFLTHFIGDLGQPLHVENFEIGGNGVDVTCDGDSVNLHALWDTSLLNKRINADFDGTLSNFVDELVDRIKTGNYSDLAADWISCSSTTDTASLVSRSEIDYTHIKVDLDTYLQERADTTPLECPHIWAEESNAINCDFLFTYDNYDDLCDSKYYTDAIPYIELQLAKQGYRLAAWLNVLFDGDVSLP